jgi:hypothetical protein
LILIVFSSCGGRPDRIAALSKRAGVAPASGLPDFSWEQPSRLQEQDQAKADQTSESQKTDHEAHRRALRNCVTDRACRWVSSGTVLRSGGERKHFATIERISRWRLGGLQAARGCAT